MSDYEAVMDASETAARRIEAGLDKLTRAVLLLAAVQYGHSCQMSLDNALAVMEGKLDEVAA
jgi:exonuclease VII small subunit